MTGPTPEMIADEIVDRTAQPIDQATLDAIASAPASIENYEPQAAREVEVSESLMRRITKALVLGTPMPRLTTTAQKVMRDKLVVDIKKIHDAGGGVELPFDPTADEAEESI